VLGWSSVGCAFCSSRWRSSSALIFSREWVAWSNRYLVYHRSSPQSLHSMAASRSGDSDDDAGEGLAAVDADDAAWRSRGRQGEN
jgi:hypothetical protein